MQVNWTAKSVSDVHRLYQFLALLNNQAARAVVHSLEQAAALLAEHPRIGHNVAAYAPKEVRELTVGDYVMRYQIKREQVYILRVWHGREEH